MTYLMLWQIFMMFNIRVHLAASTQSMSSGPTAIRVVCASDVPLYKLLSYFAVQTKSHDPKVRELNIPDMYYYTHIYHAWQEANQNMSLVAVNPVNQDIIGSNMVIELAKLPTMFAPGQIKKVLDFAIPCYESARPVQAPRSAGYISTLRATSSDRIEATLLRRTLKAFMQYASTGSYHLVWSYSKKTNKELERLKYTAITCRDSEQENGLCNWSLLDMHGNWEKSQCLYRFVKEMKPHE